MVVLNCNCCKRAKISKNILTFLCSTSTLMPVFTEIIHYNYGVKPAVPRLQNHLYRNEQLFRIFINKALYLNYHNLTFLS